MEYTKWVACYGNAQSITDREPAVYAKDLTLRYPVKMCFNGGALRFHFSNITGTEPVTLSRVRISTENVEMPVTFKGLESVTLPAGAEDVLSDSLELPVTAGELVNISIYLKDYTQLNTGVLITGPLSGGFYSYGDYASEGTLPQKLTRSTKWHYFLSTIDVLTEEKNHALICYGDSITAQDWPDYLQLRCFKENFGNVSIIRRAISGTRILREYDCITYAAYGAKGEKRFKREMSVAGADSLIIQHGINDIIHPVGEEVNPFRPWSDLPTAREMIEGVEKLYVEPARNLGYKLYSGTLLPIYGWRTYEPFRDEIRNEFNEYLRTSKSFDGCVDFDRAVRDKDRPECFAEGFDSGDHLHPSKRAYEAMAEAVPGELLI